MKLLLVSRSGAACPAPSLMELQGPLSARPHRHGWVQSGFQRAMDMLFCVKGLHAPSPRNGKARGRFRPEGGHGIINVGGSVTELIRAKRGVKVNSVTELIRAKRGVKGNSVTELIRAKRGVRKRDAS